MPRSLARKTANEKWDKAHMATIACKVKKEQALAFKRYCDSIGKSPNNVLKNYVLSCIGREKNSHT